jgi:hypothetical protein
MPANTAKGYPYPLGSDRLMDGDDAIHSLASAIDSKLGLMASGSLALTIVTGGTPVTVAVTFPVGLFTATPTCFASYGGTVNVQNGAGVQGPTTAGVNVSGVRNSAGTLNVSWLAVQAF